MITRVCLPRVTRHTARHTFRLSLAITIACVASLCGVTPLHAQDGDAGGLGSVLPRQRIELQPHQIILDPQHRTTTLTLTNRAPKPTTVELQVVFAYSVWPHGLPYDTTLFSPQWKSLVPHDTVVLAPRTEDPSVAAWVSGVPTHVVLKPHETRRITLRVTPPPNLRAREYWARVVAVVNPQRKTNNQGKPKDEKTIYKLPIRGITPRPERDSTIVFYRPSPLTMGVKLAGQVVAALDARDQYPHPPVGCPCKRVWYRIPVQLTGNAVYQGTLRFRYEHLESGQTVWEQAWELTLYHDAVIHGWGEFHPQFPPGTYRFIATFDKTHSEVDNSHRLPMRPVVDTVEFEAPL
jgi:hypothetical protein